MNSFLYTNIIGGGGGVGHGILPLPDKWIHSDNIIWQSYMYMYVTTLTDTTDKQEKNKHKKCLLPENLIFGPNIGIWKIGGGGGGVGAPSIPHLVRLWQCVNNAFMLMSLSVAIRFRSHGVASPKHMALTPPESLRTHKFVVHTLLQCDATRVVAMENVHVYTQWAPAPAPRKFVYASLYDVRLLQPIIKWILISSVDVNLTKI